MLMAIFFSKWSDLLLGIERTFSLKRIHLYIFVLMGFLPALSIPNEIKLKILYASEWDTYGILQRIIFAIGLFPICFFSIITNFKFFKKYTILEIHKNPKIHHSIFIIIITNVVCCLGLFNFIFPGKKSFVPLTVAVTFIVPLLFFMEKIIPHLFVKDQKLDPLKRYSNSKLHSLNIKDLEEQITKVMILEKFFLHSNLSLGLFAKRIHISTHQLSEFINIKYNTNFSGFINRFRIIEAQKILKNNPEYNILRIAYDVGFESKSTFNETFLKMTGMTPSQFRKT